MLAQAIKDERYEDCEPIKKQIDRLKEWQVQREVCGRKKHAAVADEQYEAASKYAKEVKRLSLLIADAATLESITGGTPIKKQINQLNEWEVQLEVCDRKKAAAIDAEEYEAAAKYAKEAKRLQKLIADAATLGSITGAGSAARKQLPKSFLPERSASLQIKDRWPCPACTFLNHPALTECEVCSTRKHSPDQKRKAAELAEKKRLKEQWREAEEKEKMKRQAAGDVLKPAPVPNLPTCRITML